MSIATWEFESPPLHLFFLTSAEIAQLVEHNLAKVGVAGPSPVFRSLFFILGKQPFHAIMNLYLRYFDNETLVSSADDAIEFLSNIDEIGMNPVLEADIREYVASDVFYPKRYKIRPRVYFIIIKTEAATMLDFKEKRAVRGADEMEMKPQRQATSAIMKLNEERDGWYEGTIDFKRVLLVPGTGKFQYRDTHFVAQVRAISGIDCYNRIVEHLRQRVDERSQFPSAKGKNFSFRYLGMAKNQY